MSSKSKKFAALRAMKESRFSGETRLDNYEIKEEGDVYDVLQEDEYQDLVETRRQREDFVVDDDGLGYYDDGEERLGDEDNNRNSKKKNKRSGSTAELTNKELKKMKKANQFMKDHVAANGKDGDENKMKSNPLWAGFRKQEAIAAKNKTNNGPNGGGSSSTIRGHGKVSAATEANMEAMLGELDETTFESRSRSRSRRISSSAGARRSRSFGRDASGASSQRRSYGKYRSHRVSMGGEGSGSTRRAINTNNGSYHDDDNDDHFHHNDDDGYGGFPQDDNNEGTVPPSPLRTTAAAETGNDNHDDEMQIEPSGDDADLNGNTKKRKKEGEEESTQGDFVENKADSSSPAVSKKNDEDSKQGDNEDDNDNSATKEAAVVTRKRFGGRKINKISEPAKKALEQKQQQKQQLQHHQPKKTEGITTTAPSFIDTNTSSFKRNAISSDAAPSTSDSSNRFASFNNNNEKMLESLLVTKNDENKYMDMYWTDAQERNGTIYLYGKIAVPSAAGANNFTSCCAVVKNNMRNLFVLPKYDEESGEYANMMNVHAEMKSVLQPSCIPKKIGNSFAAKVVKRKYAFDDTSIPRSTGNEEDNETQYMKIVYDAKYPVPSYDVCINGGENFSKILHSTSTTIENFIVKRKLMGPCWIRINNPSTVAGTPVSWCKLECQIDNPKNITRLDLALLKEQQEQKEKEQKEDNNDTAATTTTSIIKPRPPPPVVAVSIHLKTVTNPKTHKSEIVSISGICHKSVMLDTASDESTRNMTQISLVRPLGLSIGDSTGSLPQFPRDLDTEIKINMPGQLQKMSNERALLSRFITQIGIWDPDVIVGHNAWGYIMELLMSRCFELKVPMWSKLGRKRNMPSKNPFASSKFSKGASGGSGANNDWAIADIMSGRILCDTYVSAKELLRETTYSLTSLSASQLKTQRTEIEAIDIPQWFNSSKNIVQLCNHTLNDAQLVQKLMFKLQILPLTKQLTNIAGNLWSRTLKGNRAERNEYLLLHEFHQLKYIPPAKKSKKYKKPLNSNDTSAGGNDGNNNNDGSNNKAKYSGGLVLEPKKGLYDSFILLLDFNSLYPSIIQEYNLCFTTMDWASYNDGGSNADANGANGGPALPALPDESTERGVLPRVIKSLVERRRAVKKMIKTEKSDDKREELDIRQKALKLTANSMYGCLGFSHSRFYAQPIAALVTAMGRETLQRTVDVAQEKVGLDVIYGDTDSIMINTRITDKNEISKVYELGEKVKREVNGLYRTLELEIDGIFRSMLLLKKKKYAAITVDQKPDGEIKYGKETKGLDLVRRDWCIQSKDTGRYVLDQILSGQDREIVLTNIHNHLEELAKKMRNHQLPLDKYVITKGLSKHPNDYPDGKSQPHVQVAKMMLKNNRPVNTGDHIPYVITAPIDNEPESNDGPVIKKPVAHFVERARHPEEIQRSAGVLKPDVEWYLTQQILPPISRLCEPISGTSQSIIAEKLGLDTTKYSHVIRSGGAEIDDDDLVDYTPASSLSDEERFKDAEKLMLLCSACGVQSEFPGVFCTRKDKETGGTSIAATGLQCVNPDCSHPKFWGKSSHVECLSYITNAVSLLVQRRMKEYYQGWVRCDDPMCGMRTMQLSVAGNVCLSRGCNGRLHPEVNEKSLHTQLKYLNTLFDINHACGQLEQKKFGSRSELLQNTSKYDKITFEELHENANKYLESSAYNWIGGSLWKTLFGMSAGVAGA